MALHRVFSGRSQEADQARGPGHDPERIRAAIDAARERGSITLDQIMEVASGSPVDLDDALDATREAGVDLVDNGSDNEADPWASIETLADEGPEAFTAERTAPD